MRRYLLFAFLVLPGVMSASCGEPQSLQSPPPSGPDWRAIGPEGVRVASLDISPEFSTDRTLFMGLHGWDLGVFRSIYGGDLLNWFDVHDTSTPTRNPQNIG